MGSAKTVLQLTTITISYRSVILLVCDPRGFFAFVTLASSSPELHQYLLSGLVAEKGPLLTILVRKNNLPLRF